MITSPKTPAPSISTWTEWPGNYHLDQSTTTVEFSTRHLFGLAAVHGTVALRNAEIVVGLCAEDTTVRAVLDAASFCTGTPKRDDDVRSAKYLDVATYPTIEFSSEALVVSGGRWTAVGTLLAHGVTAPCELLLAPLDSLHPGTFRVTARVDRFAHGITAGRGLAARWITVRVTADIPALSHR